jgi:hypothetical protein
MSLDDSPLVKGQARDTVSPVISRSRRAFDRAVSSSVDEMDVATRLNRQAPSTSTVRPLIPFVCSSINWFIVIITGFNFFCFNHSSSTEFNNRNTSPAIPPDGFKHADYSNKLHHRFKNTTTDL